MILTPAQLRELAANVGFPDPVMAAAIAMCESRGGHTDAMNIVTDPAPGNLPERSFGLWQINTLANQQYNEASLLDPQYNARAARAISANAVLSGFPWWRPWWNTVNSGCYKQYLPEGYTSPLEPVVQPSVEPFARVTPPARGSGASTALATVGALALTAAAGFAAYLGRRGRGEEEPEPFEYP